MRRSGEASVATHAAQLESQLPVLMRRLFALESDQAADELPLAQLRVCLILQGGSCSMTTLSEEMGLSVSAVTQLADRLERARLAERVPAPGDRRVRNLQLTPSGAALMEARRGRRIEQVRTALERLTPTQRGAVLEAVGTLLDAASAARPAEAA